ncbi:hypothetical protein POM88_043388 [Heracleum sosnowskyi]|uniref:Transposase-associated domain-containing protein n=1 Tax=Heracleum sosnowskyi TaxID=360622 RepID=A0AAD8H1U5_9APIA|nr:hypothetical protein POM88_043388 [Heracleum sosnowskyi]
MNRSWLKAGRRTKKLANGVDELLLFAFENGYDKNKISCPCIKCAHSKSWSARVVKDHLFENGIDPTYTCWIWHGEENTEETGSSQSVDQIPMETENANSDDNIEIKKKVAAGEDATELIANGKSHGREWVKRRHSKTSSLASASAPIDDPFLDDVTEKIKRDLEVELEAKVNKKVQDNMTMLLKKLTRANPGLNLDIADFCATVPSEDDENATLFTFGTST